jgi:hypothetical protein
MASPALCLASTAVVGDDRLTPVQQRAGADITTGATELINKAARITMG